MTNNTKNKCVSAVKCNSGCGGAYFLAIIGASIYYIQQSHTFWEGVIAILKAIVWPAFLTYHILGL